MAYWMLVVSTDSACPPLDAIEVPLFSDFEADYEIRGGTEADWREIELRFAPDDRDDEAPPDPDDDFATIYRDVDPQRVQEQVDDFIEELAHIEPNRGAQWVAARLRAARTIYSFTPHHADRDTAMEALRAVLWSIQQRSAGLCYAEGEGWSNTDGNLVTWEFDHEDRLEGPWWCAVLDADDRWVAFRIDLANAEHRRAFREGRVPAGH